MISRFEFLQFCLSFVGLPYLWAGSDPKVGLDCSGLAQVLLQKMLLDPRGDQTAQGLREYCEAYGVLMMSDESELGDLIFFGSNSRATHVGNILAPKVMLEAAHGGSHCTTVQKAKAIGAKIEVNSIYRRNDILGIYRLRGIKWE